MGNILKKQYRKAPFSFLKLPLEIQWKIIKYLSYDDYQSLLQAIYQPNIYRLLEHPIKTNNCVVQCIYKTYNILKIWTYNKTSAPEFMSYDINVGLLKIVSKIILYLYPDHITTNYKIQYSINLRGDFVSWILTESLSNHRNIIINARYNYQTKEYHIHLIDITWVVNSIFNLDKLIKLSINRRSITETE